MPSLLTPTGYTLTQYENATTTKALSSCKIRIRQGRLNDFKKADFPHLEAHYEEIASLIQRFEKIAYLSEHNKEYNHEEAFSILINLCNLFANDLNKKEYGI